MVGHLSDQLNLLNTSFVGLEDYHSIACLSAPARCYDSGSTNDMNLFDWPMAENMFETIIIFLIQFGDASSTEITHLTFNVPIEDAYICDGFGKEINWNDSVFILFRLINKLQPGSIKKINHTQLNWHKVNVLEILEVFVFIHISPFKKSEKRFSSKVTYKTVFKSNYWQILGKAAEKTWRTTKKLLTTADRPYSIKALKNL